MKKTEDPLANYRRAMMMTYIDAPVTRSLPPADEEPTPWCGNEIQRILDKHIDKDDLAYERVMARIILDPHTRHKPNKTLWQKLKEMFR